jgi:hypothetical protein
MRQIRRTLIFLIFSYLIIVSCESPLKVALKEVVKTYSTPIAEISPLNGEGISDTTSIIIIFTEEMNPATLELSGTLISQSNEGVWSADGGIPNTILTLSPLATWQQGSGHFFSLSCQDTDGYDLPAVIVTYGVLDGNVYVNSNDGSNANPGTASEPKADIRTAIELADRYYSTAEVRVSGGVYNVDYSEDSHVVLVEGISVYGGYSPEDWSNRDPGAYESKIQDSSAIITGDPTPEVDRSRAVACDPGITGATIFDGFTVVGGSGSVSIGFDCSAAEPTIQNNELSGGSGEYTAGLRIRDASPHVTGNTISGGIAVIASVGVYTNNSSAVVENNDISGGTSDNTDAVFNYQSSPIIKNNRINGGFANDIASSGVYSFSSSPLITGNTIHGGYGWQAANGIYSSDSSLPVIRNNLVYGGTGPGGAASITTGILSEDSDAIVQNNTVCGGDPGVTLSTSFGLQATRSAMIVENNIIFADAGTDQYGVFENAAGSHPVSFKNNNISGFSTSLYSYWDGSSAIDYSDMAALNSFGWADANLDFDPLLVDIDGIDGNIESQTDNDWHLSALSPAGLRAGGLDLSTDFYDDIAGTIRTAPWSIGAYEEN